MTSDESIMLPTDELAELELSIARRADELMSKFKGSRPERDFWLEAESEIWSQRLSQNDDAVNHPVDLSCAR